MDRSVIRTKDVTKVFKSGFKLEEINISIKKGEIFGLIGQNGAGKSTLLRLIAGLSYPTSGTIERFGFENSQGLVNAQKRMGVTIENPALYPHMTAHENLEVHRLEKGVPGKACIERALELVGLIDVGRKKVKHFSLGMKQRLGIALALLSDPEFLILDEPTNGLDPTGIVELRELIKNLNQKRGLTVLISSHILSEIYQLATRFCFIHQGRILEQLTKTELDEKCRQHVRIKVDDAAKGALILERDLATTNFEVLADGTIKLYSYLNDVRMVSRTLTENDLTIEHLSIDGESLENYYRKLLGGIKGEQFNQS